MRYYYLVASLPDLSFPSDKLPITRDDFEDRVSRELDEQDASVYRLLQFKTDNENMIMLLEGKDTFFQGGAIAKDELADGIQFKSGLPSYMLSFIDDREKTAYRVADDLLAERYAAYGARYGGFLKEYFNFDRDLMNVTNGLLLRQSKRSLQGRIVGSDDFVSDAVLHSNLPDFGIGKEFSFVTRIMEFIEARDYAGLEVFLDQLRFSRIDELTPFSYFDIEQVLAYSLKLKIIERWVRLDDEQGKTRLEHLSNRDVGDTKVYQYVDHRYDKQ